MLNSRRSRDEEARRKAQEHFDKIKRRDAEAVKERERLQQADAEKTDRLRALRLAKEAAEKEALAFKAAQPKPAAGRRKRTAAA